MSGLEAGFRYPDIVKAGIHLVIDPPIDIEVRVDHEGERKAEERRRQHILFAVRADPDPRPRPRLKTIHLQWLDKSYVHQGHEAVWRDVDLHVDLDKKRLHNDGGGIPFLSRGHQGSGAIGVVLFAAPVLAVMSPYLYVRARIYRARERKHGMSRHAIVLLEKIKGQLDPETEALLREAFKNEWTHDLKMGRRVSFQEAGEALAACDLTERRMEPVEGDGLRKELLRDFIWFDDEGDMIGHAQFVDEHVHFMRVLGSRFEDDEAKALTGRFRTRKAVVDDEG